MPIFFHFPKTFSPLHSLLLTESPLASYFSISVSFCLRGTAPGLHVCLTRAPQDHSAPCFVLIPPSQGLIAPSPGLIPAPQVSPGPDHPSLCPGEGTGAAAHSLFILV